MYYSKAKIGWTRSIKTTLGTYGHLYPNMNKEVANRLNNILNITTENTKKAHVKNQYTKDL